MEMLGGLVCVKVIRESKREMDATCPRRVLPFLPVGSHTVRHEFRETPRRFSSSGYLWYGTVCRSACQSVDDSWEETIIEMGSLTLC